MLNDRGEFVAILPRYCEELGVRIVLDVEDKDRGVSVCDCPCIFCTISTLANNAGVFPSFKIFPTRVGVLPIYLTLRLLTLSWISPTTIAPKLNEAVFTW